MGNVFVLRVAWIFKGDEDKAHFFQKHTTLRLFEWSCEIVEKRYLMMTFQISSEAFGSSSCILGSSYMYESFVRFILPSMNRKKLKRSYMAGDQQNLTIFFVSIRKSS